MCIVIFWLLWCKWTPPWSVFVTLDNFNDGWPVYSLYLSLNCFTVNCFTVDCFVVRNLMSVLCAVRVTRPLCTEPDKAAIHSSEVVWTVSVHCWVHMCPRSSAWLAGSDRKVTAAGMGYLWEWNEAKCSQCWNKHPDLDACISCCGWLTLFEVLDPSGYLLAALRICPSTRYSFVRSANCQYYWVLPYNMVILSPTVVTRVKS